MIRIPIQWPYILLTGLVASALSCTPSSPSSSTGDEELEPLRVLHVYGDEEDTPLSRVSLGAANVAGFLAIADGPPSRVLLFDPDGNPIPIGGSGLGPAEYQHVSALGFLGDSLWITDARMSKALYFDLDGNHLGTERIVTRPQTVPARAPTHSIRRTAAGSVLMARRAGAREARSPPRVRIPATAPNTDGSRGLVVWNMS